MNNNLIIINPDRFSEQNFPPFLFLCRCLKSQGIEHQCISAKELDGIESLYLFSKNSKFKPSFCDLRFAFFSLIKVWQRIKKEEVSHIIVFRSFDSIVHLITALIFRKKIVFLVDYLPWSTKFSLKDFLINPRRFLQLLGLKVVDRMIVPTMYIAQEIKTNLPSIKEKVFIVPYSSEIYESDKDLFFKNDSSDFVILASVKTRKEAKVVLRAFAKLEKSFLILQTKKDNFILALSHSLGLLEKIQFVETDLNLLNLIPKVNLFICEGSGGYIISALNSKVPVVASDRTQNQELIKSKDFLYSRSNVESLFQLITKVKTDKKFVSEFFKNLNFDSQPNWSERVLKALS